MTNNAMIYYRAFKSVTVIVLQHLHLVVALVGFAGYTVRHCVTQELEIRDMRYEITLWVTLFWLSLLGGLP